MRSILIVGLLFCLPAMTVLAAGPESVAKSDRSLWPDTVDSTVGFDRASRAEILVFTNALVELSNKDDEALKEHLRIKSIERTSINRVRDRLLNRLLGNFKTGEASCAAGEPFCVGATTISELIDASRKFSMNLPEKYRPWFANAETFHRQYAGELVRLAALFPKVSSEIDTFGPEERTGLELPDKQFLWTFDDGPSTKGGTTDSLIPALREQGIHAMYYMLGERLKKRLQTDDATSLRRLYDGQCVGLHGWAHDSHQRSDQWQTSILDTQRLIQENFGAAYRPYFRPPYGQRRSDSASFFSSNNLSVALWNIDSQDWNAKVSDRDAAQRVLTLMLLWRRGVILFHDVHMKAINAIPWVVAQTTHAGLIWKDCREY